MSMNLLQTYEAHRKHSIMCKHLIINALYNFYVSYVPMCFKKKPLFIFTRNLVLNCSNFLILSIKTKLFSINFDKVKELCQSCKLLKINYLHTF
jgi:hypothetical protein